MQEQKIKELLEQLFSRKITKKSYDNSTWDSHIVDTEARTIVEQIIREFALNNRDNKIGELEAKVMFYEEMIKKSTFAPMITHEQSNENNKCNLQYVINCKPEEKAALNHAVSAIYFNDNSDYLSGLYGVVRSLTNIEEPTDEDIKTLHAELNPE